MFNYLKSITLILRSNVRCADGEAAFQALGQAATRDSLWRRCRGGWAAAGFAAWMGFSGLAYGQSELSVTNGLALWLRADVGITTNASGAVLGWIDQSGNGNNAGPLSGSTGADMPLLVTNLVNGRPAVQFDGVSSVLEIPNSPSLQPGTNDWTVIVVAKRLPASQGDFPVIIGSRPWTAAADLGWAVCFYNSGSLASSGMICSQLSDGTAGHDVSGALSASPLSQDSFQIWQVEESRTAETTTFYKNGDFNLTRLSSKQPTGTVDQTMPVYFGRDTAGGGRRANMDLAEVMVYGRLLTTTERQTVTSYLSNKYDMVSVSDLPPTLTPKPSPLPRINSPKIFGVRPGAPFLYTIAATGDRPMTFAADGLPSGLQLDPQTGRVTGSLKQEDKYNVTLRAMNALGVATSRLKIICGTQIGLTPALGWNSWNCFGLANSAERVKAVADAMVTSGLINHGWTYINIDTGWQIDPTRTNDPTMQGAPRDPNGYIIPNRLFPDMKGLVDYIHSLGLKAGIYSSPGPWDCAGGAASFDHELLDVQQYTNWGFDYLKYDWCSYTPALEAQRNLSASFVSTLTNWINSFPENNRDYMRSYAIMRAALNQVNRDIVYSINSLGSSIWEWGADVGANSWRTAVDISDNWESVHANGFSQISNYPFAGPGHFNDPDMLVVGIVGGWESDLHPTRLTPNEQYAHISLWCLLASPLLIGCDMTQMDPFTLGLFSNDEVLEVDQDQLGRQAARVSKDGSLEVWAKDMEDGSKAVGLFNCGDSTATVTAKLSDLGLTGEQRVRDLWRQKDLGTYSGELAAEVPTHGVVLAKMSSAYGLSVTNGLVLWLRANAGITTDASGAVLGWIDQSGNGNDAGPLSGSTGADMPLLVTNLVNGRPAVQFDGVSSVLEIPNSPSLQPGTNDWTVIVVAKRLPASQGDFPVIIGSRPWTAAADLGWAVCFYIGNGVIGSQLSDGTTGHDVSGALSASPLSADAFQIWQVEEDRSESTTTFYKNGALDNSLASMQPTESVDQTVPVYLGRDTAGGGRRANMDLAEVLVYNRVLTEAERQSITNYLGYALVLQHIPPAVSLTQPTNNTVLSAPADFTLAAQAASSSTNGSIQKVDFCLNNGVVATAFAMPYTVHISMPEAEVGTFTFMAVATDERGCVSTSAPVTVTITGPTSLAVTNGLALWLRADAGITTDASGAVLAWRDQSGNGNNAGPLSGGTGTDMPLVATKAVFGTIPQPVVQFDGVSSVLEIANSPSLQPGTNDWTVIFVAKRLPASAGDYPQIIGSRPWTAPADLGWAVCLYNGTDGWATPGVIGSQLSDGTSGHDVGWELSSSLLSEDAFQIWQVEENRTAGTTSFYKNGVLDRALNSYQPTNAVEQTVPIYMGRDTANGGRRANMDLADVLIFNRTLSAQERTNATAYLMGKYPTAKVLNQPPVISLVGITTGASFVAPTTIALTANATDSDGSVAEVAFYNGSTLLGVVTSAPYTLNVTVPLGVTQLTLSAVATDNLGATSATPAVTVQVFSAGVDYSDTFTTNAIRPDGLFNQNQNGAYTVENSYGNPAAVWTPTSNFSFNTPNSSSDPTDVSAASGDAGASGGFAQSAGGDFSLAYGLRTNYVVQVQAIFPSNRLDISSLPAAGDGITAANSLTVFLRSDTLASQPDPAFPDTGLPGISLFNGSTETAVTKADGTLALSGVANNNWHAVAVQFDQGDSLVRIYVDGVVKAQVNLSTFAGGLYQKFSNGAVGVGGSGSDFWIDNFAVGAPVSLISTVDYADTFTTNSVRTAGLFNDDSGGAYNVEEFGTNTPNVWIPYGGFTFSTPDVCYEPAVLGAALGNPGATTGFAQTAGNDCGFYYNLRSNYVVQVDCILPDDRLDITMQPSYGGMFEATALNIFLRRDSTVINTGMLGISLYNVNLGESAVTDANGNAVLTGVNDNNWHNFAINFDQFNNKLYIYVDRVLKGTVNMNTFASGNYKTYSNYSVAWGGATRTTDFYLDNFQVGAPAVAPFAERLRIGCQNGQVVITWTGSGTLEQAESVTGSWTPVSSQSNPYIVTPTSGQMYYRLKQ